MPHAIYTRTRDYNWLAREASELKKRLTNQLLKGVTDTEERTLIKVQISRMDVKEVQTNLRELAEA